ncbi:MAG: hypothetical protein J0H25_06655, partial [Rhizobiales bacterium]|nr:hypothetical protein [Hyphomicrobiales bacterium]
AASIKLPKRIPYHIAMDMLLTGRWLDAEEGHRWGFVNEIVPAEKLMERAWELARLLSTADHVAVCLPLTSETRHLFNTERIAQMKAGAYLYNVGRGQIVDSEALVEALQSGHLGGAGLDVTDPEPLPPYSPLWRMENVVITAHTAGATPHYWERATEILAANIERINAGQPPLNLVNQQLGY